MKKLLPFILLLIGLSVTGLVAQEDPSTATEETSSPGVTLHIDKIVANEKEKVVQIILTALNKSKGPLLDNDASKFTVLERQGIGPLKKMNVIRASNITEDGELESVSLYDSLTVLFLMDMSGSMKGEPFAAAKEAVRTEVNSNRLDGDHITVLFSTFENEVSRTRSLRKDNFGVIVDSLKMDVTKDTDLHRALRLKINEMKGLPGNKVIILLTDGEQDVRRNPLYKGPTALKEIPEENLLAEISSLDSTFRIYPVGLGTKAKEGFLKAIAEKTINGDDRYYFGVAPKDLGESFRDVTIGLKSNFQLKVRHNPKEAAESDYLYKNENRTYFIKYSDGYGQDYNVNKSAVLGTTVKAIDLRPIKSVDTNSWQSAIIGLLLVALLLGILVITVPIYNDYHFKKNHIKRYSEIKKVNVTSRDPLTLAPIQDHEEVVWMNNKVMLLETWKYLRSKGQGEVAKDYSEFFQKHTKGGFFSQKGTYKRLNWLWFGALGGFIAWGLNTLFNGWLFEDGIASWEGFKNLLAGAFDSEKKEVSSAIYSQVFLGISLGLGITATLATVEELGQSRKISVGRILARVLLGVLVAAVVFFLESLLTSKVINHQYFGGLIGWTLFGTLLGLVVTFYSSLETKNGLLGGLLAGFLAYQVYAFLTTGFMIRFLNADIARIIGLISYGGILGFILYSVVARLEDFSIRYLSPAAFAGKENPISKWLKSSSFEYIYIGTAPGSEVLIKWRDEDAKNKHGRMSYDGKTVFIEPLEGDILINGVTIAQKTALKDLDKIRLGLHSISEMQFIAKNQGENTQINNGSSGTGNMQLRPTTTVKPNIEVRKKIKIKPRKPIN